ncbi:MAG: hypothetical protein VZQ80_08575 [Lachnospiraceae bacterium]|nr:hypothetical protein [Lachnospiraceae bacterium]
MANPSIKQQLNDLIAYFLLSKKYCLDEEEYDRIVRELEEKHS